MPLDRGEPIYLDGNDDAPLLYIDKLDTTSPPDRVAATGLSLTVKLAAVEGGAAINAALSKTLTETPASSGWYLATFEGSDITAQLATYVNKDVVMIAGDGSNVNKQILRQVLLSR
jgi:hypothetical protein